MVELNESSRVISTGKQAVTEPSLKRWFKHFFYINMRSLSLTKQDREQIAAAVSKSEHGHSGEIQVVIEGHLPYSQAYQQDTLMRARDLFAELGVWDTAHNSGVLLYLNLCEHRVEIVADRGINQSVDNAAWVEICDQICVQFARKDYVSGILFGVEQIGQILARYYQLHDNDNPDELPNEPIFL